MKKPPFSAYVSVLTSSLFLASISAQADTHIITQEHMEFSDIFLKMENNDTIKFVNLDTVNHRLVFSYKGQEEKLAWIKPGDSQEVLLDRSGIYDVHCLNHPEMKLTVFIPHVASLTRNISNYDF
jgi:plastocyanin